MTKNSFNSGVSLPIEIVVKIDKDRGDIPRSKFILRILEKYYEKKEKEKK